MKKKHRRALREIKDIVRDIETCLGVLDEYTRRVLGRFADIPMENWAKHMMRDEKPKQDDKPKRAPRRKINRVTKKIVRKVKRFR